MISPRQYFPWKVGRLFLRQQLIFVGIVAVVAALSIRYYVYSLFSKTNDVAMAVGAFDRYLSKLFVVVVLVCGGFQIWIVRRYFMPLGRVLQRARELRRLDFEAAAAMDAHALDEEPGEWNDLERTMNRIHRDLRKQTEDLSREREELSALISGVSDAILAVNQAGEPLFFNSQFALLFNTSSLDLKSIRLSEIFRAPDILRAFGDVLTSGQPKSIQTSLVAAKSNLPRHFMISITPLRNKNSEQVYGAVGSFHDVTELKQAEQIRIEFVGNASHELRTPLTSIKGYLDTLSEDLHAKRYDEVPKFLEIIHRNVDRLTFLVSDLLDLSTIESGAELKKIELDPRQITQNALRQLEDKRDDKRQLIEQHYSLPLLVADEQRTEQVLVNLVQNAIKYIPEGHRIDIFWEVSPTGGAQLRVKDNGQGISEEHLGRLFERFYRVDTGRTREQGGTGLGLAIVKHIMIKHGGTVSVVSSPGQGTEFICRFPAG